MFILIRVLFMGINCNCVLVLCYVDNDWLDLAGNKFSYSGFIQASDFRSDIDIRYGLYGILWGKTHSFIYESLHKGYWAVVKTQINDDLILVDQYTNRYKFKEGIILLAGSLNQCANKIISIRDQHDKSYEEGLWWVQNEDIIGSKEWMSEHEIPSWS